MSAGEPITVVLTYTVHEGEVFTGWSADEVEAYHAGDPEAFEQFESQAAEIARTSGDAPDVEVIVP